MKTNHDDYLDFEEDLNEAYYDEIIDYLVRNYELSLKLSCGPYGSIETVYIEPQDENDIDIYVYDFKDAIESCFDIESMISTAIDSIDKEYCQEFDYWLEYVD